MNDQDTQISVAAAGRATHIPLEYSDDDEMEWNPVHTVPLQRLHFASTTAPSLVTGAAVLGQGPPPGAGSTNAHTTFLNTPVPSNRIYGGNRAASPNMLASGNTDLNKFAYDSDTFNTPTPSNRYHLPQRKVHLDLECFKRVIPRELLNHLQHAAEVFAFLDADAQRHAPP
ncbi:hypothetical protein B0H14DRAFT_3440774 [Mycena olivaceomarginata]|nr:hypothetical protein B0H14DRAFT_3440774 [Mycena olivaceomarginata]